MGWEELKTDIREFLGGGDRPVDRYVTELGAFVYGVVLLLVAAVLLAGIVEVWPAVDEARRGEVTNEESASLLFGWVDVDLNKSTGLLFAVLIMGALGGFVHAATSFATFGGNRTLRSSWMWWYWLRLPIGATLALAFYFVLRAGLIGVEDGSKDINSYGAATLAFLAGLFSKQAVDKLKELFDTFVNKKGDEQRFDKAEDRRPVIERLQPDNAEAQKALELTIHGQRFRKGAKVRLGGDFRPADFKSEKRLVVDVPAEKLDPGTIRVAVVNPAPHDEQSNVKPLRVDRG